MQQGTCSGGVHRGGRRRDVGRRGGRPTTFPFERVIFIFEIVVRDPRSVSRNINISTIFVGWWNDITGSCTTGSTTTDRGGQRRHGGFKCPQGREW